jgi:hypothetical protein
MMSLHYALGEIPVYVLCEAQFVHYLEVNVNIFVFIAVDSSLYGMFTISRLYCICNSN